MRENNNLTSVGRWLDPDAKAFTEIRNAIEHRSLKIVDDFGYTLTQSGKAYRQDKLEELKQELNDLSKQLEFQTQKSLASNEQRDAITEQIKKVQAKIYDQQKLSTHSLLITESEFKSRLMTLMKLVRNSIMYLSFAINLEEKNNNLEDDAFVMERSVPLK